MCGAVFSFMPDYLKEKRFSILAKSGESLFLVNFIGKCQC
ncbi:hypothetical protein DDI_2238 [Dickeya dianthicola RNS04.9]|nr:hypothetical protein DDI_2238 [Dickeya dianthicola RNS04.9]